jgi:uncharacterized protein (TIGR02757 family)
MLPAMVRTALGPYLDRLASSYDSGYLHTDPVGEVRRFTDPEDREVAAFLAAGLAFGRVDLILVHLRDLWRRLDETPAFRVDNWSRRDAKRLAGFVHRWVRGDDLDRVLASLGRVRRRHGSLRSLFLVGYDPHAPDLRTSLSRFVQAVRAEIRIQGKPVAEGDLPRGVRTFFADPNRGGACKRLNLFLRWMVRPDDGVDLGLLPAVRTDQLVIPLDTHVSRISRYLGLTRRRTVDWKMAVEVTEGLKELDRRDPVRYDFAISRLGILDACTRHVDAERCAACALVPVCTLGARHGDR